MKKIINFLLTTLIIFMFFSNISYSNSVTIENITINEAIESYFNSYTKAITEEDIDLLEKYTDNSGGHEGDNYNNTQFKYFSHKNDCQNYVSQCIWYGFGGRSSENRDLPMNTYWWADTKGTSSTWNWTSVSRFYNYITNNYKNNNYGIQGYSTTVSVIKEGDFICYNGHVLLVSAVGDTNGDGINDYHGIKVCAHTTNRKGVYLSSLYSTTPPEGMEFIKIVRFKWNTGE